jgi:hypothetical protein
VCTDSAPESHATLAPNAVCALRNGPCIVKHMKCRLTGNSHPQAPSACYGAAERVRPLGVKAWDTVCSGTSPCAAMHVQVTQRGNSAVVRQVIRTCEDRFKLADCPMAVLLARSGGKQAQRPLKTTVVSSVCYAFRPSAGAIVRGASGQRSRILLTRKQRCIGSAGCG